MKLTSRETKYHMVASLINEKYLAKAEANTLLPTERQLQEEFEVSRDTVRRALRELIDRKLIYNVQGSGTFVAPQQDLVKLPSLRSFTEDMTVRGHRPHTLTLVCHLIEAPLHVQRVLNLESGAKVIEIQRLRQADGSPIALETAYFLPEAFSQMEPEQSLSLDAQMRASGYQVESATVSVLATNLTQSEANHLEVPLGAAALRVEKIGRTGRGLPVENTVTLYRGDRYDYELELTR